MWLSSRVWVKIKWCLFTYYAHSNHFPILYSSMLIQYNTELFLWGQTWYSTKQIHDLQLPYRHIGTISNMACKNYSHNAILNLNSRKNSWAAKLGLNDSRSQTCWHRYNGKLLQEAITNNKQHHCWLDGMEHSVLS